MKTLQLPKYKTTHAHAPESTVDVVVFLFYVLNFRFYRTPKQTILAEGFEGQSISGSLIDRGRATAQFEAPER